MSGCLNRRLRIKQNSFDLWLSVPVVIIILLLIPILQPIIGISVFQQRNSCDLRVLCGLNHREEAPVAKHNQPQRTHRTQRKAMKAEG